MSEEPGGVETSRRCEDGPGQIVESLLRSDGPIIEGREISSRWLVEQQVETETESGPIRLECLLNSVRNHFRSLELRSAGVLQLGVGDGLSETSWRRVIVCRCCPTSLD
jgi:hypothetical protein